MVASTSPATPSKTTRTASLAPSRRRSSRSWTTSWNGGAMKARGEGPRMSASSRPSIAPLPSLPHGVEPAASGTPTPPLAPPPPAPPPPPPRHKRGAPARAAPPPPLWPRAGGGGTPPFAAPPPPLGADPGGHLAHEHRPLAVAGRMRQGDEEPLGTAEIERVL